MSFRISKIIRLALNWCRTLLVLFGSLWAAAASSDEITKIFHEEVENAKSPFSRMLLIDDLRTAYGPTGVRSSMQRVKKLRNAPISSDIETRRSDLLQLAQAYYRLMTYESARRFAQQNVAEDAPALLPVGSRAERFAKTAIKNYRGYIELMQDKALPPQVELELADALLRLGEKESGERLTKIVAREKSGSVIFNQASYLLGLHYLVEKRHLKAISTLEMVSPKSELARSASYIQGLAEATIADKSQSAKFAQRSTERWLKLLDKSNFKSRQKSIYEASLWDHTIDGVVWIGANRSEDIDALATDLVKTGDFNAHIRLLKSRAARELLLKNDHRMTEIAATAMRLPKISIVDKFYFGYGSLLANLRLNRFVQVTADVKNYQTMHEEWAKLQSQASKADSKSKAADPNSKNEVSTQGAIVRAANLDEDAFIKRVDQSMIAMTVDYASKLNPNNFSLAQRQAAVDLLRLAIERGPNKNQQKILSEKLILVLAEDARYEEAARISGSACKSMASGPARDQCLEQNIEFSRKAVRIVAQSRDNILGLSNAYDSYRRLGTQTDKIRLYDLENARLIQKSIDPTDGMRKLRAVVNKYPGSIESEEAMIDILQILQAQNRHDESIRQARQWLQINRQISAKTRDRLESLVRDNSFAQAQQMAERGKKREAIQAFESFSDSFPKDPRANSALYRSALLAEEIRDLDGFVRRSEIALERAPNESETPTLYLKLIDHHVRSSMYREAAQFIDKFTTRWPKNMQTKDLLFRGASLAALDRELALSSKLYSQFIAGYADDPRWSKAVIAHTKILRNLGKEDDARKEITRITKGPGADNPGLESVAALALSVDLEIAPSGEGLSQGALQLQQWLSKIPRMPELEEAREILAKAMLRWADSNSPKVKGAELAELGIQEMLEKLQSALLRQGQIYDAVIKLDVHRYTTRALHGLARVHQNISQQVSNVPISTSLPAEQQDALRKQLTAQTKSLNQGARRYYERAFQHGLNRGFLTDEIRDDYARFAGGDQRLISEEIVADAVVIETNLKSDGGLPRFAYLGKL